METRDEMRHLFLLIVIVLGLMPRHATAQRTADMVWVQIEARPTFDAALERAQAYARDLPDVNGFALRGGWYAIVLGPYTPADADAVIRNYRAQGSIPSDSYIAFNRNFAEQYFPQVQDSRNAQNTAEPAPEIEAAAPILAPVPQTEAGVTTQDAAPETPAQARRSESLLTAQERRDLQTALRWAGYYNSTIDGAFGRGTRNSMSIWQGANGFETTGILTTRQRAILLGQYNAILDGLDMQLVRDAQAGIDIRMPTALVSFARYEAPFAHFDPTRDMPVRVLLISQTGGQETLKSLYEIMQTLTIVPLEGPRRLNRDGFSLVGRNRAFVSETQVQLAGEEIKGFTLIWPTGDEARRTRVLEDMRDSLVRRVGVLDPSAGISDAQRVDLVSGLEVRTPRMSRSGFYVDNRGSVVTTADAVQSCTRITLDDQYDATLAGIDADRGIAVLTPRDRLAPPAVARFSPVTPRLQSEIAVAGYSFEGQLDAPSMTFGQLSDVRGLRGEENVTRLALEALPGDAGGPVMDAQGHVFGMLLPPPGGNRQLPDDVRFALTGDAITAVLERAGMTASTGDGNNGLDAIALTNLGVGMTVLVSCWE
ncbi:MAG: serine protease [Roseobacter sp.]